MHRSIHRSILTVFKYCVARETYEIWILIMTCGLISNLFDIIPRVHTTYILVKCITDGQISGFFFSSEGNFDLSSSFIQQKKINVLVNFFGFLKPIISCDYLWLKITVDWIRLTWWFVLCTTNSEANEIIFAPNSAKWLRTTASNCFEYISVVVLQIYTVLSWD